jgi:hypothetical protein
MDIRITIEVAEDFTRRGLKWKEHSRRQYELRPFYLTKALETAISHAEDEYGTSSAEACFLRLFLSDLTK